MVLQRWLDELRSATSEEDVVRFARSKLERAVGDALPPEIARHGLATGNDVREMAAGLAAVAPSDSDGSDLTQQMLIVFSLATDRLADLERRGMVARRAGRATSPG
jgi:hypothetical protein